MYRLIPEQQTLTLRGTTYTAAQCIQASTQPADPFVHELFQFLADWFAPTPYITVHTSGSTGAPKELVVCKEQMIQSACMTCAYLHLQPAHKALLCMPLSYIAGKMVVVRALVAGLDLYPIAPTGHPLATEETTFQFAAMIPLQVYNTLQVPLQKERLARIETLIIGGGSIDPTLSEALQQLPGAIYSTYGMTETLSHIAMRRLNGPEASPYYTPFPDVTISLSVDNTLQIHAPRVNNQLLSTTDIARLLPNGQFEILGRKDNTINSGGIKIQLETLEATLHPLIGSPFAITSLPDAKFGEVIVLLLQAPASVQQIEAILQPILRPYEMPKKILLVSTIPLTTSGKINRAEAKEIAKKHTCPYL